MHPSVHSSIVYNSQDIEATWIPINGWMNEEDMVYIYHGILLSHKKEWDYAICSNMDEPRDYHSEVRQRETNIWHPIYGEIYKNVKWSYLQNRNRLRKQTYGYQRGCLE